MALITREAMKYSLFRRYVSTYTHHISRNLPKSVKGIPQEDYTNLNKLIWTNSIYNYTGANGVKTGFTDEAGNCLVASAQKEERESLSVVMKTDRNSMYKDSTVLLDYGFNEFKQLKLVKKGDKQGVASVKRGDTETVDVVTAKDFYYNIPLGTVSSAVEKKIQLLEEIEAPLQKGQKIGAVTLFMGGKEIGIIDLVSDRNVGRAPFFNWKNGLVIAGFLLMFTRLRAKVKRRHYHNGRKRRYYQKNW